VSLSMRIKLKLTIASLKMYLRQREAIIWNFLLPVLIIVLFGFVKFGGVGHMDVGLVNEAGPGAATLIEALKQVRTIQIEEGPRQSVLQKLEKGELDFFLLIPDSFRVRTPVGVTLYADVEAKPRESQLGELILQRVLDDMAFSQGAVPRRVLLRTQAVKTRNLTYIDFLVPGVLSMTIMQVGIFGVAFGFVSLKKRGILRRLWVTPIGPGDFIIAQVVTRLLVLLLQMALMLAVGIIFFNLHVAGSILSIVVVGLLGAVVFLGIGFTLAGISKSEDQVAPLANVITLPMMLLSGVFFSRSNLPGFVHAVTDFFPLTYLADGMRSVAIDGASLLQVGPQLVVLAVWSAIACGLAVKSFRWE
jgi:ABC-2 type transport system permease protein